MSEQDQRKIEAIQRYNERTRIRNNGRNELSAKEVLAIKHLSATSWFDAILLAFLYGRAKGYRMAKAEGRK